MDNELKRTIYINVVDIVLMYQTKLVAKLSLEKKDQFGIWYFW